MASRGSSGRGSGGGGSSGGGGAGTPARGGGGTSGNGGSGPNRRTVMPGGPADKPWQVAAPGADRASSLHRTQGAAIDRARQILARDGGGELTIRGTDGRIRDSDTVAPGNDPSPPVDKR